MKKLLTVVIAAGTCFLACKNNTVFQDKLTDTTPVAPAIYLPHDARLTPEGTVIHFLKWYRDNEQLTVQQDLIDGGLGDNSTAFYIVNYQKAERYLTALRSSGCLSEAYISDLREYIRNCNTLLLQYPQNDGPAPGFDFDLVMKGQDYADILEHIDSAQLADKKINDNKAFLRLRFNKFQSVEYFLSKDEHYWKIDSIYTSFKREFESYVLPNVHIPIRN